MWWKRHKGPILLAVLIAAALTAAFLHDGRTVPHDVSATAASESRLPVEPAPEEAPEPPSLTTEGPEKATDQPAPVVPAEAVETAEMAEQTASVPAAESTSSAGPQSPEIKTPVCTISISCATILEHMDECPPEKAELVPADGWILQPVTVSFTEGSSVFDVLQQVCRQYQIHMEYMDTPGYGSAYIEGIHNLYEFDVGGLSGWMYSVNGQFPNHGCSQAILQDGDVVCWVYTCDRGADVGENDLTA